MIIKIFNKFFNLNNIITFIYLIDCKYRFLIAIKRKKIIIAMIYK